MLPFKFNNSNRNYTLTVKTCIKIPFHIIVIFNKSAGFQVPFEVVPDCRRLLSFVTFFHSILTFCIQSKMADAECSS